MCLGSVIYETRKQSKFYNALRIIEDLLGKRYVNLSNFEDSSTYEREIRKEQGKNGGGNIKNHLSTRKLGTSLKLEQKIVTKNFIMFVQ